MDGDVLIVGGGIGGLTLALALDAKGVPSQVFEAAPEIEPLGVGINLLPHATRILTELGLLDALRRVAVETRENLFYNHHGQRIWGEPCGLAAGYDWPQFSIHRGDLHLVLYEAARERLGAERIALAHKGVAAEQDAGGVTVRFEDPATGKALPSQTGMIAVGCDGFHSAIRRQFFPDEPAAVYSGINLWRGVTRRQPYLTGASVARAGALETGKFLIYPIRNDIDGRGTQLINWAAELKSDTRAPNDWNQPGRLDDFFPIFQDWHFDWLDVAELIQRADFILEYPMVDRDPLPRWSFGRVTLLGDAAHPMYPRGSNGGAQAIIDAETLAGLLADCARDGGNPEAALAEYEQARRAPTAKIVQTNRTVPPDTLISTVEARTGGAPFERLDDVISQDEITAIVENYRRVTGYAKEELRERAGRAAG